MRATFGPAGRRRGFTFTEILFAVLILGIGFILVAAIFPVALRQTEATSEETVASTIAKGGVSYLAKYNTQSYWYADGATTPDGLVHPIAPGAYIGDTTGTIVNSTLWPLISGNLILPSDARYAWVPMYRQVKTQPYVQVILIGVQARNRNFYDATAGVPNDLTARADGAATLEARPMTATFNHPGGGAPDTVVLGGAFVGAAAPGAYIVVSNDNNGASSTNGTTCGWVYRLGNSIGVNTWNLAPGNDMNGSTSQPTASTTPVDVLMVGAGYTDANTATITYNGPVQDIAIYTTFITVH